MPTYTLNQAPADYDGDGPKSFPLIPEDTILEAVITEVEEDVKPFKDRDTGEQVVKLKWTFQTEYDGQERKVWGETGTTFFEHPDCRFYTWTQEAFGAELPKGFVVDTDNLLGEKVRVVMGVRTYTKKTTGEEKTINFVADVMRAKGAPATAPAFDDEPF